MQTNNEGWIMHTPQSFKQTPVRIHKSKRKELFSGIKVPRKRTKKISKPEFRSGQRESCLQQFTESIANTPSDIVDWAYTKNNDSSDISAEVMTSANLLENYSSNQLLVGNIGFYSGEAMDITPTFEKDPVLASAFNSYSYNNVAEDQFDPRLPARPQTFSADLGRYSSFGYLPLNSESVRGSADTSVQPSAPSYSDIQSVWETSSQGPNQSGTFTFKASDDSFPIDTIPHTPSRHIEIPNLDFTCSTVESQGEGSATPYDLSDTPTRETSGELPGLNIFESEGEISEVDWLKDAGKIGELGDFESFEDFLTRDICKHTVHSGTII